MSVGRGGRLNGWLVRFVSSLFTRSVELDFSQSLLKGRLVSFMQVNFLNEVDIVVLSHLTNIAA